MSKTSAVGTWQINSTLIAPTENKRWSVKFSAAVSDSSYNTSYADMCAIAIYKSPNGSLMQSYCVLENYAQGSYDWLALYASGRPSAHASTFTPALSGKTLDVDDDDLYTHIVYSGTTTITITGGDDVTNPELVAWLKANATKKYSVTVTAGTDVKITEPAPSEMGYGETATFKAQLSNTLGWVGMDISAKNCTVTPMSASTTLETTFTISNVTGDATINVTASDVT